VGGVNRFWPLLLLLASIWGASYLFIKVGVEGGLEPAPIAFGRSAIAAVILFAYVVRRLGVDRALAELRGSWRQCAVIGSVATAIPFWLVGWGETHIDSGIAAIAQSTMPLFTILLGLRFLPHEPLSRGRVLGFALGLVGVAVLAGVHPEGGWWAVAGTLAVVLSSLAYASGSIIGQRSVGATPGPVLAAGAMSAAAFTLLPFAVLQAPTAMPDTDALLSVLALALLGTALGQLILYRMLDRFGARSASLVTYLMPAFALVYGAVLLDEAITVGALGGLALILGGVALGSGAIGRAAAREPAEVPAR
jgi:drug/metabolite transporter (DMT)-like permease